MRLGAFAIPIGLMAAAPSLATTTMIDISSGYDTQAAYLTNGGNYPDAGSTIAINGVSFQMGSYNGSTEAGIVATTWNNAPSTVTIDIADIANVTTLYTIINSAGGTSPLDIGAITLNFTNGSSYSYQLVEGTNIRDHYNGGFNNSAPALFGTATYPGNLRLDAQEIIIPVDYLGLTLDSLTVSNTNASGGSPMLFAATAVSGVPEPATWTMMIGGFGLIGGALRWKRKTAVSFG